MISASASEAEPVLAGCCCAANSDPEPLPADPFVAVWEKTSGAEHTVVSIPMKQIFNVDESCFELLRSVFTRTLPFDTHLCWLILNWIWWPTLNWK